MFDLQNLVLIFRSLPNGARSFLFTPTLAGLLVRYDDLKNSTKIFGKIGVLEIWKKRKVFTTHRCANIIYISTRLQHLATFETFIIFHDFGARPLSDLRIIQAIRCWCPQHHFHQSCCCLWRYKRWCFNFNELFNSTTVMQLRCLTSYYI